MAVPAVRPWRQRLAEFVRGPAPAVETRDTISMSQYHALWANAGLVPTTTYAHMRVTEISNTLPAYMAALRGCPPAFAAQMVRALVLSQARFTFRRRGTRGSTRKTFGTPALRLLEQPWPGGTTGQLLTTMEWHAGVAGNAYVTNRTIGRLRVLRPDWVAVVYGSDQEPEDAATALDGELLGYAYANGGLVAPGNGTLTGMANRVWTLLPDEVAHYTAAGLTDPEGGGIGMSWLTPALRDMQVDKAAADHKLMYFKNSASPNLVVKGIPAATKEQFQEIVDILESQHAGVANAFKTYYLTAGADVTVVGNNFRDMDLKNVTALGETRVSSLSRVPASMLGISEGLEGSALNGGNFEAARRVFSDTWVSPTLQDYAASLAPLVDVPSDAELWPDTSDMPVLRDDSKAAAEILQIQASTMVSLVNAGYEPESVKLAVISGDYSLLKHTGNLSVQLRPAGSGVDPLAVSSTEPFAEPEV
ncbi:MAG TPA: phage portal protein [Jiangellales bacterium]|nr:phage portal protein [Jiangellales bacterium]